MFDRHVLLYGSFVRPRARSVTRRSRRPCTRRLRQARAARRARPDRESTSYPGRGRAPSRLCSRHAGPTGSRTRVGGCRPENRSTAPSSRPESPWDSPVDPVEWPWHLVELRAGHLLRRPREADLSVRIPEEQRSAGNDGDGRGNRPRRKAEKQQQCGGAECQCDQQHLRARRRQAERAMQPGRTARPGASKKAEISMWYGVVVTR